MYNKWGLLAESYPFATALVVYHASVRNPAQCSGLMNMWHPGGRAALQAFRQVDLCHCLTKNCSFARFSVAQLADSSGYSAEESPGNNQTALQAIGLQHPEVLSKN